MFEFISERPNVEDWHHDLDLMFGNLNMYSLAHYKTKLHEQLNALNNLLNQYDGVKSTLQQDELDQPYWFKLVVRVNDAPIQFESYVKYEVNADKKLVAVHHFTHQPSTEEFPIEEGVRWKTLVLKESEIKNPGFVVANIKNTFICFESYRQIGREITYAVMNE